MYNQIDGHIIDGILEVSHVYISLDKTEKYLTISEQCDGFFLVTELDKQSALAFVYELLALIDKMKD